MFKIREMQPDDFQAVSELHNNLMPETGQWSPEAIARAYQTGTGLVATIEDSSTLVGFILVQHVSDTAEILTFGVDKFYRRQGVATQLLATILALLKHKNLQKVMLDVRVDNKVARQLYEKFGFIIVTLRPNYYKTLANDYVDAIVMQCYL